MLALEYSSSVPRYAAARLSRRAGLASLRLVERRPPALPAPDWLPVRPRLSGICGSDHALVDGGASLYLSSLTSTPFVPGHEIVGEVVAGDRRGERVVVEPALGCLARGIEPPCPECAEGRHALCREVTAGQVSAGLQIGFCRETGGGWSEGLVAHRSQLHPVPDELDDEDAVLIEPLACALHAVRQAGLDSSAAVAVIGAGAIGLMTIAALRELHAEITVVAVAKHRGQELEARRLGADEVCAPGDLHLAGARLTGARRLVGHAGRELLLGGFDAVLDCVGSGATLEAAVTVVRPRGTVVLVGMPGRVTADLALAWQREVEIRGAYGYRDDFGAALELATRLRPGRLVAHGWVLRDYRRALEQSRRATRAGRAKTVFDLRAAG
ncbi:MAG TPA: zinc-binding dehydrogenase [Thermoleophilaceae bacterium]|nr:zinc-binding dehydrogenase [Thermoleophilaceae bacterium]